MGLNMLEFSKRPHPHSPHPQIPGPSRSPVGYMMCSEGQIQRMGRTFDTLALGHIKLYVHAKYITVFKKNYNCITQAFLQATETAAICFGALYCTVIDKTSKKLSFLTIWL